MIWIPMSIQCMNIKISKSKEQNKRILLRIKNITQFMSQLHACDKKNLYYKQLLRWMWTMWTKKKKLYFVDLTVDCSYLKKR